MVAKDLPSFSHGEDLKKSTESVMVVSPPSRSAQGFSRPGAAAESRVPLAKNVIKKSIYFFCPLQIPAAVFNLLKLSGLQNIDVYRCAFVLQCSIVFFFLYSF